MCASNLARNSITRSWISTALHTSSCTKHQVLCILQRCGRFFFFFSFSIIYLVSEPPGCCWHRWCRNANVCDSTWLGRISSALNRYMIECNARRIREAHAQQVDKSERMWTNVHDMRTHERWQWWCSRFCPYVDGLYYYGLFMLLLTTDGGWLLLPAISESCFYVFICSTHTLAFVPTVSCECKPNVIPFLVRSARFIVFTPRPRTQI